MTREPTVQLGELLVVFRPLDQGGEERRQGSRRQACDHPLEMEYQIGPHVSRRLELPVGPMGLDGVGNQVASFRPVPVDGGTRNPGALCDP